MRGVYIMANYLFKQRLLPHYSLMLMSLLILVGILSGCGASSTGGPSHSTGTILTSTPIKELKGTITEIPLPANVYVSDITKGPDSNLWFTAGDTIGRISPSGIIRKFPLPANSFSKSITAGPDGNLWFKEPDKVGRITPSGAVSEFRLSFSGLVNNRQLPYTHYMSDITTGPDHALWFTEPGIAVQYGKIGRITSMGKMSEFPLPDPSSGPGAITNGPDDTIWFNESNSSNIGHLI
jgi:virginiamycin B lyase